MKYLKALTKNRVVTIIHRAVADWIEDGALSMSAALAYYSVFSIAPLIIIAIYIAGVFFGPEAVRGQLDEQIRSYVGSKAAEAVQTLVQSAYRPAQGWLAATMGILALIFGASGVFGQLKDALNTIWEVQPKYTNLVVGFLRDRLLNFAMGVVLRALAWRFARHRPDFFLSMAWSFALAVAAAGSVLAVLAILTFGYALEKPGFLTACGTALVLGVFGGFRHDKGMRRRWNALQSGSAQPPG